MRKIILAVALLGAPLSPTMAETPGHRTSLAPSARIESPPTEEKLKLIRRFMTVVGIQSRLNSGSFLERYAFVPELGWHDGGVENRLELNLLDGLTGTIEALKGVYEKYRPIYQNEYEQHLNWEFTEEELRQMVAFLDHLLGSTIWTELGVWKPILVLTWNRPSKPWSRKRWKPIALVESGRNPPIQRRTGEAGESLKAAIREA